MNALFWMRRLVCMSMLMVVALHVQAAEKAADLHALQFNAYRATTQMMMFVILDRAPDRHVSALESLESGDAIAAKLTEPVLRQKWQSVRAAVMKDPYTNGEINSYAIYDMENLATELAFEIHKNIGAGVTARQKSLYELAGIMQSMMTIYLR